MNENPTPSELPEGFLLAYLEGTLDDAERRRVEQALAQDPGLRQELEDVSATHEGLAARLAQAPASTQELGDYLLGLLPPERASAIETRLASDAHLRAQAVQLRAYLADLDLPPAQPSTQAGDLLARFGAQVNLIVAELVQGLAGPAPAPQPVRGGAGGASASVTYRAGAGQILLEIQPEAGGGGTRSVLGLLLDIDQPETLAAGLYAGEVRVASAPCDELGNFALTGVDPGSYDLLLSGPTLEILVPGVAID